MEGENLQTTWDAVVGRILPHLPGEEEEAAEVAGRCPAWRWMLGSQAQARVAEGGRAQTQRAEVVKMEEEEEEEGNTFLALAF